MVEIWSHGIKEGGDSREDLRLRTGSTIDEDAFALLKFKQRRK